MTMLKANEESYHICGDQPDPTGMTDKLGVGSKLDMTGSTIGKPEIRYEHAGEAMIITADVYRTDGELLIHLICPMCSTPDAPHGLHIRQSQKRMEFENGYLSIEPFQCTWETDPELRRDFGLATCQWRVAIERNVARDV